MKNTISVLDANTTTKRIQNLNRAEYESQYTKGYYTKY